MSTYTTRIMLESALQLLYLLPTKCQGVFSLSCENHSGLIQQLVVYFNTSLHHLTRGYRSHLTPFQTHCHTHSRLTHTQAGTHTLFTLENKEKVQPHMVCVEETESQHKI